MSQSSVLNNLLLKSETVLLIFRISCKTVHQRIFSIPKKQGGLRTRESFT